MSTTYITEPEKIIKLYPNLIYHWIEEDREHIHNGSIEIIYKLTILSRNAYNIPVVNTYIRKMGWAFLLSGSFFSLTNIELLTELVRDMDKTDVKYQNLKYTDIEYRFCRRHKHKFRMWLGVARQKIVDSEAHPARVQKLLESGIDLDDIETIIDSKLAGKLSW